MLLLLMAPEIEESQCCQANDERYELEMVAMKSEEKTIGCVEEAGKLNSRHFRLQLRAKSIAESGAKVRAKVKSEAQAEQVKFGQVAL